jgi:hypothetical protein
VGYLTGPDADGAVLFDFVVAKIKELGNPADAVQLYVADFTIKAFRQMDDATQAKVLQVCHPANHPFGAMVWQTFRLDEKLPNGNYDQSGKRIAPNSLAVLAGTTLKDFKAHIAAQTPENYNKTPYALATVKVPFYP